MYLLEIKSKKYKTVYIHISELTENGINPHVNGHIFSGIHVILMSFVLFPIKP